MKVRIWGCRGSLPTALRADQVREKLIAGLQAARGRSLDSRADIEALVDGELPFSVRGTYGGASSCVEMESGTGEFLICDLGSGLRELGLDALRRVAAGQPPVYHVLLSHLHWDHVMGFPFFAPAYRADSRIHIYGGHREIEAALRRQQSDFSFPVPFDVLSSQIDFHYLSPEDSHQIAGLGVSLIEQQHAGRSYGYRVEAPGAAVVYSTDSEHRLDRMEHEQAFVEFFAGADLVIFDTMYSLADAVTVKEDWGHSSNVVAVDLCREAGVRRLCMFHHEPAYDDAMIEQVHRETIRYEQLTRRDGDSPLEVLCAYDGMVIDV